MNSDQRDGRRKQIEFIACFCAIALTFFALATVSLAEESGGVLTRQSVLHDPDIPSLGNPNGDITIVEYFDYQCPYCKKAAPLIDGVVQEDGNIILVLKDWPIFGALSTYAAKLALAAKFQNKYPQAHAALIGANTKLTEPGIRNILEKAGVDVVKATADLQSNQQLIDALLARNSAQADAFGFQGTPSFIVGTFRVPGMLNAAQFKQAISDARAAAAKH